MISCLSSDSSSDSSSGLSSDPSSDSSSDSSSDLSSDSSSDWDWVKKNSPERKKDRRKMKEGTRVASKERGLIIHQENALITWYVPKNKGK